MSTCTEQPPIGERPVIMVVDDDAIQRLLITEALEEQGCVVHEADNGRLALERFVALQPDIVLLDVMMPEMDGFTACAEMRKVCADTSVPIVVVTGLDDTGSIDQAYSAGATDFITKPINFTLLGHRLKYILRASSAIQNLQKSERRLSGAQRVAKVGYWEWDAVAESYIWSSEALALLSIPHANLSSTLSTFLDRVHPNDRDLVEEWFVNVRQGISRESLTHRLRRDDGSISHVRQMAEVVQDKYGVVRRLYGVIQDTTELREAEAQVRLLAYCDAVTGLPTRAFFHKRLEQALRLARRNKRKLAMLFLDVDNFKRVNDTLGRAIGDRVLKEIGERLGESIRITDLAGRMYAKDDEASEDLARLGGDEFAVMLTEVVSEEYAAKVAQRVLARIEQPFIVAGHEIYMTVSVGISTYPRDGVDTDSLLKHADLAMYFSKRYGKNNYQFYDAGMNESAQRKLDMESRLRNAISRAEMSVVYQPQLDMSTGRLAGVEALLRWKNDQLGEVPPANFIPLAEDTGLIIMLGEWILLEACRQLKDWRDAGLNVPLISVNVSPIQFEQTGFVGKVAKLLDETGLEPGCLELEITENLLARSITTTAQVLQELKALGVKLAIDDFGTGYSNFRYLKKLPIDRLKIDEMFVQDVNTDTEVAAIASAVIAVADSMRLQVVAEGVETESQRDFFVQKQCDAIQGFLFSDPVSADRLVEFVQDIELKD